MEPIPKVCMDASSTDAPVNGSILTPSSSLACKPDNYLRTALTERKFVCTAELVLGRDHTCGEAEAFVNEAAQNGIPIISLTDLPGGNPTLPPEAFVSYVLDHGLTPIAHLSGKDGNRSLLEARLHGLARLGVENILALTGDAQKTGIGGQAKPVYDLDSVLILWLIQSLRDGLEYNIGPRAARTTPFSFYPGAVVNPFKVREPDLMMQLYKLQLKVAVGAQYIITQLGYNLRKLHEVKLFMFREGMGHVPLLANIYVPTARIAQRMQAGEIAGCVISDKLLRKLEREKKPQRIQRAASMVAAVQDLGFAGAHIGGYGLTCRDFLSIRETAAEIGSSWRDHLDELVFPYPGEFYLLPPDGNGLSQSKGEYQVTGIKPRASLSQNISERVHRYFIQDGSWGARFFGARLGKDRTENGNDSWRRGFWYKLLQPSFLYRKATLGCISCGDCLQDHLNYAGCSMRWCHKELRNGPCGGSRVNGTCEAHPDLPCIWNLVYLGTLAVGDDPRKFGHILVPPRNWCLDKTNALANRFVGLDNRCKRTAVSPHLRAGVGSGSH